MAIFGWLVLVIITAYFYYVALASMYCTMGFTGKVGIESYIFLLIAIILSIVAYKSCPFSIILN